MSKFEKVIWWGFCFFTQHDNEESDAGGINHEIPRSKVLSKIQEISDYKKSSEHGLAVNRSCWIVKQEILAKFQLENLEASNNWEYILELPTKSSANNGTPTVGEGGADLPAGANGETPKSDRPVPGTPGSSLKSKVAPSSLITKFTKVLSEEERQIQLMASKPFQAPVASPAPATQSPVGEKTGPSDTPTGKAAKKKIQPTLLTIAAAFGKSLLNAEKPESDKPKPE